MDELPFFQPKHLLWTLLFLKGYSTENIHAQMAGCSAKTFRKWVWFTIDKLSNIEVVRTTNKHSTAVIASNDLLTLILSIRSTGKIEM